MSSVTTKPLRVFIVDDHMMVLAGVRSLLEDFDDIEVIGSAGTCENGLSGIAEARPDVALIDLRLPDGTGAQLCKDAKAVSPETRFLVLTSYTDDGSVFDAIAAGVDGYLLKEVSAETLVDGIRNVFAGKSVLTPAVTDRVFGRLRGDSVETPAHRIRLLSRQERRVLAMISEGKTNKEAGVELGLSDKTVKNYLANAMQKLHVARRTEAVAFYVRHKMALD